MQMHNPPHPGEFIEGVYLEPARSRWPCRHHNPTNLLVKPADPWLQGFCSRISATWLLIFGKTW